MAYRGTNTKQGFFAKDFNIRDTLSSHVGILLYEDSDWLIYNVNNFKDGLSDFRYQNLKEFYAIEQEKINYACIYEVSSIKRNQKKILIKGFHKLKRVSIKFDKRFLLDNPYRLYCSEFVRNALYHLDSVNLNFQTHKRELKGIYKTYFRKDSLEYYPVDIFQLNPNLKKIKHWSFPRY
ncbi:MAG: hypothetical protein HKP48_01980 [Winogradskyella sp.]|uniref:YiiX/YebB-like N1pC/P60 family cysteine hydrolase n=1 Tax=Winogradskyella sp. TaxID=1883156 RepID=UPI001801ABAB|nr:YiiX/YebB-like N1pC/P60 family cysteine hydrolase [Winogradskyella sp.]MBT8243719.1 hypothetical protein [Winogradskyella sp.]NNK22087.1 hypothetical protein [Winogradskyella sp.]